MDWECFIQWCHSFLNSFIKNYQLSPIRPEVSLLLHSQDLLKSHLRDCLITLRALRLTSKKSTKLLAVWGLLLPVLTSLLKLNQQLISLLMKKLFVNKLICWPLLENALRLWLLMMKIMCLRDVEFPTGEQPKYSLNWAHISTSKKSLKDWARSLVSWTHLRIIFWRRLMILTETKLLKNYGKNRTSKCRDFWRSKRLSWRQLAK